MLPEKIQKQILNKGRQSGEVKAPKSNKGIKNKTQIDSNIATTPNNLLGIVLNIP